MKEVLKLKDHPELYSKIKKIRAESAKNLEPGNFVAVISKSRKEIWSEIYAVLKGSGFYPEEKRLKIDESDNVVEIA